MHFAVQMNLDRVKAEFLERSVESNLVLSKVNIHAFESVNDFMRPDASVQVTFVVGIGLDGDRLLGQLVGLILVALELLHFDLSQFLAVFFDHPLMVIRRDGCQTLGQQIIKREPRFHFDKVTLLAQVFDVVDQQQLDTAVIAFRKAFEVAVSSAFGSGSHGELVDRQGNVNVCL